MFVRLASVSLILLGFGAAPNCGYGDVAIVPFCSTADNISMVWECQLMSAFVTDILSQRSELQLVPWGTVDSLLRQEYGSAILVGQIDKKGASHLASLIGADWIVCGNLRFSDGFFLECFLHGKEKNKTAKFNSDKCDYEDLSKATCDVACKIIGEITRESKAAVLESVGGVCARHQETFNHYVRAVSISESLGPLDSTVQEFERALSTSPLNPWGHFVLGYLYLEERNLDKAISSLQKAEELNSNFYEAIFILACAYFEAGETDEALQLLTLISKRFPKQKDEARVVTSVVRYFSGSNDDSDAVNLQAVLSIEPQSPEANYLLGYHQFRQGKIDDAIQSFGKVVKAGKGLAEAYYFLTMLHLSNNDKLSAFTTGQMCWDLSVDPAVSRAVRDTLVNLGYEVARDEQGAASRARRGAFSPILSLSDVHESLQSESTQRVWIIRMYERRYIPQKYQ